MSIKQFTSYIVIPLIICILINKNTAQVLNENLAPYLCNDNKYGLANSSSEKIVECEFDNFYYLYNPEVFRFTKNKEFTYYSKKGIFLGSGFKSPIMPGDFEIKDTDLNFLDSVILLQCEIAKVFTLTKKNQPDVQFSGHVGMYKDPSAQYEYRMQAPLVFKYGIALFLDVNNKMNLVDTSFNILLKSEYSFIKVLNDTYCAGYKNGKFHVINYRTGKTAAYSYNQIHESHNQELFIVNSKNYDDRILPDHEPLAQIINAEGKIVNNEKYHLILPAGKNNFIAKISADYFLLDTDGNKINTTPSSSIKYLSNNLVEYIIDKQAYLYDSEGNRILDQPFRIIKNINAGKTLLVACFEEKSISLYNSKTKKFISEVNASDLFSQENEGMLLMKSNEYSFFQYNINSIKSTSKGDKVQFVRVLDKPIYIVNQDSSFSIYDNNLDLVIGPIQGEYEFDVLFENILIKEKGEKLFTVYDGNNYKALSTKVVNKHFLRNKDLVYRNLVKGKIIVKSGEVVDASDYKIRHSYTYENGNSIITASKKGEEDYYVFDEFFNNITPEGYSIPRTKYDSRANEYGMFAVYNGSQSGVINSTGQWVLEPSPYNHKILSTHIIQQEDPQNKQVRFKHYVLQQNKWNLLEDGLFKFEDNFLICSSRDSKNNILSYVLDEKGNTIIPKTKSTISKKYDNFLLFKKVGSSQHTDIYSLDGKLLFSQPYYLRHRYKTFFIGENDKMRAIIDLSGNILAKDIPFDFQYFPNFELYIKKERGNTDIFNLSGEIFLEGENIIWFLEEKNNKNYLILSENGLTKVFDENKNKVVETSFTYKSTNNYIDDFIEFHTNTHNKIYISTKTFKTLVD